MANNLSKIVKKKVFFFLNIFKQLLKKKQDVISQI